MICGLCCQNTELTKKGIRCSRTCRQATYTPEKAITLGRDNLKDCVKMIEWNYKNNIKSFRMSSDILPHYTNPNVTSYSITNFDDLFTQIGQLAKEYKQRITFHPDQFNCLGSPTQSVVENTFNDLSYHAEMMDKMNISEEEGVINIHGGGVYGNKESAMRRWIENFDDLPSNVKKYLTIENDEHSYSLEDCLYIAEECRIPVVYDTHHEQCYRQLHSEKRFRDELDLVEQVMETFDRRNKLYLFHVSSQKENARIGSHSDFITELPSIFNELVNVQGKKIYVDIEAKMKEQAIFDLRTRYNYVY